MAAMGMALAPADLTFPMERRHGHLPSDRSDPITETVAKKIIELAQTGIRDSARLGRLALQEIGISGSGWVRAFNARRRRHAAAVVTALIRNRQPHEVRLSVSGRCGRLFG
jgi:hypothetical protein